MGGNGGGAGGRGTGSAGAGGGLAGSTTGAGAGACVSFSAFCAFSTSTSWALLTKTPAGIFTTGAEVGTGSSGERDSWAGSAAVCMNSCSSASAEIVSIVLETLLTAKLRSFSRDNNDLLSMPIFLASSWMRMLIR